MHTSKDRYKEKGYELIGEFNPNELNQFISKFNSPISTFFIAFTVVGLLAFTALLFLLLADNLSSKDALFSLGLGLIISLGILPIHEVIHFIAFKAMGAKKVIIKSFISKGYLLTIADQFYAGKREIIWVSLAPFFFITVTCISFLPYLNTNGIVVICTILVIHTSICSTDIKMADYFLNQKSDTFLYSDLKKGHVYLLRRTIK
ncbi:MAG: DUF3267 domain-containing protein [Saprospiraceae bacterium]|nr:DUF3267 domain-containing protein [Saprospiraceae bacterium]